MTKIAPSLCLFGQAVDLKSSHILEQGPPNHHIEVLTDTFSRFKEKKKTHTQKIEETIISICNVM